MATLYVIAEALAVLTLALAVSTRLPAITGGIIVLAAFGLVWMGGIAGAIGTAFRNAAIENVGTVTSLVLPSDGLWRGALYYLEPAVFIAANTSSREASANPFSATAPPTTPYMIWCVAWIVAVLGLAIWSFSRREL
jgi:ABC-type transport system involved in multi-copper enzyme maturation permease subunit